MQITSETITRIMPLCPLGRAQIFIEPLNDAMEEFEINTPERRAAFLAQIAIESGSLLYMSEIATGDSYNDREDLGNTRPDAIEIASYHRTMPGPFWKGHGLIQITGYDNHKACGEALGLDLVNDPRQLCDPPAACRSAAWFWKKHGCNEKADYGQFKRITLTINGGLASLSKRVAMWESARDELSA